MEKLDKYLESQKELFEYFGYVEDWVSIPIEDAREYFWDLIEHKNGQGHVCFHENAQDVLDRTGEHYENIIYTQRFLPKWVYRGKDFTMICVDTRTDGNKFLQIFDNAKEVNKDSNKEIKNPLWDV